MKLDLRALLAGERLVQFAYLWTPDIDPTDTSSFLYGTRFPSPMKVTGEVTNTAGYMRMTVDVSAVYDTACARCLAPISDSFSLHLEKTVAPRDVLRDLDEDRLDDYAIIEDGFLDMDDHLLQELEMEFPYRFLCREDCKGLCSKCGKNLNEGECACEKKEIDPRLLPLQKILERMKEENK